MPPTAWKGGGPPAAAGLAEAAPTDTEPEAPLALTAPVADTEAGGRLTAVRNDTASSACLPWASLITLASWTCGPALSTLRVTGPALMVAGPSKVKSLRLTVTPALTLGEA